MFSAYIDCVPFGYDSNRISYNRYQHSSREISYCMHGLRTLCCFFKSPSNNVAIEPLTRSCLHRSRAEDLEYKSNGMLIVFPRIIQWMLTYSKADDPNVPKTCTDRAIKEHFKIPVIMTPTKKKK